MEFILYNEEKNPPNVPQAQPIEMIWTLFEQKVYENNWEARNSDQLARRILLKVKEINQKVVTYMIFGARKKLLRIYRKRVYLIC